MWNLRENYWGGPWGSVLSSSFEACFSGVVQVPAHDMYDTLFGPGTITYVADLVYFGFGARA